MGDLRNKYILLQLRVGQTVERNIFALGLATKSTPTQVLRGDILAALPEAEQPKDSTKMALVGIDRRSVRLECTMEYLTRLSDEDANLLLAISSPEDRYHLFIMDRVRLDFGRKILPGCKVYVAVKGISKKLPGIVWYKGELPSNNGTMFGVELTRHPGQGTSDGTFMNKRYFTCPPDSGVFVGIDKLTPREDPDSKIPPKSPERDGSAQANFKSRLMDTVMPSFIKGKNEQKSPQERINQVLERGQRVVTFIEDHPARGTVCYIGQEEDASGNMHTIVGLQMDEQVGTGTGKRNGRQLFICRRNFALFVDIKNLIREEDFDGNYKETTCTGKKTPDEQDATQEPIRKDEPLARSMSYDYEPSDEIKLSEKDQQGENSQRQLSELEQLVIGMEQQLRELREKDRELENSERLSREREQHLTNFQRQLREKELQEAIFHEQLREKEQQEENSQRQLMEIQQQLRDKDEQEENLQGRLREMEQQLREKNEQEGNLQRQLREMEQQLRGKDEQEENLQRQLRQMEQQLINLQGQCKEKEQESSNLQERFTETKQQVYNLERQLRDRDQDLVELNKTLSEAEKKLKECKCQEKRDWIIPRDEIVTTNKRLGEGSWGYVNEGKYCGSTVAVKKLNKTVVISSYNRKKFEREMDIASRCRHPCLLQFIGATNDEGSPLFVTELMELSLRQLLQQRQQPLSAGEVVTLSLDVARALSYLHQKKPSPILHRDVSSANVLLWRRDKQWRAKVSDYGTANFLQETMTANPGTMIYSAPEAFTQRQTVKIDVYSFGVLLCEMCIQEMPDSDRRDEQVSLVKNPVLQALIRRCLQSEADDRPNIEEIIVELEQFNETS